MHCIAPGLVWGLRVYLVASCMNCEKQLILVMGSGARAQAGQLFLERVLYEIFYVFGTENSQVPCTKFPPLLPTYISIGH